MKAINKKTLIIGAISLVVGLLAGWLIFGGNKKAADNQKEVSKAQAETVWTCSMHPQVRQQEPGDCPICGMDLIPVDETEGSDVDAAAISMSPTAMQLASIRTAVVGKTDPVKQVRLNGKVQPDERLLFSQSSHIPGRIEELMVSFTGQYVNEGQTIARIYSPDLVTAQEELFEAQKIAKEQPALFAAAKEKLKNWKLSDKQIAHILESGEIKENFPVTADISGYVSKKMVNTGDYVSRGQPLYEIADLSSVWVLFDVYESDMPWIEKGDMVSFTIASLPGEEFKGEISYLDPVIDPKTRVAKARIEYKNPNGKLKPEMFASGTVKAELDGKSNALVIPKTAVMWTGKRSVVYVKNNTAKGVNFVMREVLLGPALGDSYIVENGIKPGEEIAVHGTFSIDAAAQLAGKPSMMSPDDGQASTGHQHGSQTSGGKELSQADETDKASRTSESMQLSEAAKKALEPLYSAYLEWKEALSEDDFARAQKSAKSMKTVLTAIDMEVFEGDAHMAWMEYQEELKKGLEHVHHHDDIEPLRKSFQKVSVSMIEMTQAFDPLDDIIYVQHCPMADNDKGADWLSTDKEIKNPYFGSSMLKCGEITREIK